MTLSEQLEGTDISCRLLSHGHVSLEEHAWLNNFCERSITAQIIKDKIMALRK